MLQLSDINIRDPFIVPVPEQGRYYMYGSNGQSCWGGGNGFDVFTSGDLKQWDGPISVFRPPAGFWADRQFWAPEVYRYRLPRAGAPCDQWIMFATFKAEGVCRGTQALIADEPTGPFLPHSQRPLTPADWECLDGHLYVDCDGAPWIIFCHEWLQIGDGTIEAMRLTPDLRGLLGKPTQLFRGSQGPWVRSMESNGRKDNYVTDGPFIIRAQGGALLMLWSSRGVSGYAMGQASSPSGTILGPWQQADQPLVADDGGHGMVFRTFDGRSLLSCHRPNSHLNERPVFLPVQEHEGLLRVGSAD
jgi:hypothetical protein